MNSDCTQRSYRGLVEKFPGRGGWFFIRVPEGTMKTIVQYKKPGDIRAGLYPIEITISEYTWKTSICVYKNGTGFIPLKSDMRKKTGVLLDEYVRVSFVVLP